MLARVLAPIARAACASQPLCTAPVGRRSLHITHTVGAIAVEFDAVDQARLEDVSVNVTFVNYSGQRTTLPGRVGQSLLELADAHGYNWVDGACGGSGAPVEKVHPTGWREPVFGEGAYCSHCHVILPKDDYASLLPPAEDEVDRLEEHEYPEQVTDTSRLACQVKVTKDMDGMVVYVPDGPPSDIP